MVCLSLFHSITLLLCFSSHFLNLPSIHLLSPLCSYQSPSLSTILITNLLYIAISLFILSFCHLHHPFTLSTLTIWSFPLSLCHPHQLSTLLLLLSHPSPYLLPFQILSIQHGHFTLRRVVFSLTTFPLIHFHFIHHSFISTFIVEMNIFTKNTKCIWSVLMSHYYRTSDKDVSGRDRIYFFFYSSQHSECKHVPGMLLITISLKLRLLLKKNIDD